MHHFYSRFKAPVKSWASILEPEALEQAGNVANMPFIHKHVALMADAHAGKGSTVGTVIATRGAIMPAAVGVDIGCGMCAMPTSLVMDELDGDGMLRRIRDGIEAAVPVGFRGNATMDPFATGVFTRDDLPEALRKSDSLSMAAQLQCGSLGGGNHFIEVCSAASDGRVWIMLHSGSRRVGKELAEIHIDRAKRLMKRYFIDLPDPDLAYLVEDSDEFKEYRGDLMWAQDYAMVNRKIMMGRVAAALKEHVPQARFEISGIIDCHHNYVSRESHHGVNVWVTRKGAVRAREGDWGIIPGSMGARSHIVRGKGNPDSFHSCSHGAGRVMSRKKARSTFTVGDLEKQTQGVECRKDADVIDEIPAAYKPIEKVMADQQDLVDVVETLSQFICVKG